MPTIVNSKTGFVANASDKDWSGGVYDTNTWKLQTPATTAPATAPATPAPVAPAPTSTISTSEMSKPADSSVVSQAQKMGTFVNYNPQTGAVDVKSRKAGAINDYDPQSQLLETRIPNVAELQSGKYVVTNKIGNDYYGVLKPQTPQPTQTPANTATQTATPTVGVAEQPKTAIEQKQELVDNYFSNRSATKDKAMADEGVDEIKTAMATAQETANKSLAGIEQAKSDLELQDILNTETQIALKDKIEGKPIPMSDINAQLTSQMSTLDQNQRLDRLYDVYKLNTAVNVYNAQTRNVQLLQGQYEMAMNNVKESVADWSEWQNMQLDLLTETGQLEKEARSKYESEINYERGLMEEGYVYVESTDTYNELVKKFGVTASTFSNFFYKDPANGKIYLKPGASTPVVSVSSGGSGRSSGYSGVTGPVNTGNLSARAKAVYENPILLDKYTPTEKGKILDELTASGADMSKFNKPLEQTAITQINQTQKAISELQTLKTKIQQNIQYLGPITGLQALNPWSKARQVQSDINRVKQTVGKALEGGVLRKEDEEKYKKILATLTDTPETAAYKVDALLSSLYNDLNNYKSLQEGTGRYVPEDVTYNVSDDTKVNLRSKYAY